MPLGISMKENGKTINEMEKESCIGKQLKKNILDIGMMDSKVVSELISGLKVQEKTSC